VSTVLTGEWAPSRRSDKVPDPPAGTTADGAGVGRGRPASQPTPVPSDTAAEDPSPGGRGWDAPGPPSALVPRFLVGLYEAVRDLGSAGAARNARAAVVNQGRDVEELMRVETLVERAVERVETSRLSTHDLLR
jgi:hypothetical protein